MPSKILPLRIQADDVHARLPQVAQDQLQQIGLALAGVAKDQDGAVGLVLRPLVKVHQDIAAELVPELLDTRLLRCPDWDIFCSFQIGTSNPVRRESLPSALPTWFSGIKNTGHIPASGALPYHHSFFCLCFYYKAGDCPIPFCSCPSLGNGISNSRRISFWDSNSLSAINSIKPLSSLCACSSRDT